MDAFDGFVAGIIRAGMIIMPIIALGGAALERDWRGLGRMVGGLIFSLALGAWWIFYLADR